MPSEGIQGEEARGENPEERTLGLSRWAIRVFSSYVDHAEEYKRETGLDIEESYRSFLSEIVGPDRIDPYIFESTPDVEETDEERIARGMATREAKRQKRIEKSRRLASERKEKRKWDGSLDWLSPA